MVGAPRPLSPWPPKRAVGPSAGSAFGASRMCRRIAFSPSCRASWRRGRQSTPTDGAGIPGWRTLATSTRSPSSATVWIQPTKSCRGFILSPRFSSGGFSALIRAAASNNTSITTSTNSLFGSTGDAQMLAGCCSTGSPSRRLRSSPRLTIRLSVTPGRRNQLNGCEGDTHFPKYASRPRLRQSYHRYIMADSSGRRNMIFVG